MVTDGTLTSARSVPAMMMGADAPRGGSQTHRPRRLGCWRWPDYHCPHRGDSHPGVAFHHPPAQNCAGNLKVADGAMRSPREASRWIDRSLFPVFAAVSAVKRSRVESPTWRLFSLPLPTAPCRVSGCSASYASFRRLVNSARSAAVRFRSVFRWRKPDLHDVRRIVRPTRRSIQPCR